MSVIEGVAAYKARKAEEEARREAASRPKVARFALEQDGDSVVIRFAQEIDPDAKNYDPERGLGFINIEHKNGADAKNGWKNRANCTLDSQGECYPCSLVQDRTVEWDKRKGWKQQEKFYINLIGGEAREVKDGDKTRFFTTDVDRDTGDGVVYLLEQSTHNGIYDALVNWFVEEEVSGGTILGNYFKISRKGNDYNNTEYSVTALGPIKDGAKDLQEFELYDIKNDILREVDYARQPAFYAQGMADAEEPKAQPAPVDDDTW